MTELRRTAADVARWQCGQPHPSYLGTYCTRPKDHKGGHLDEVKNDYWQQAEESVTR